MAGAMRHDILRGSVDFFKLFLLSYCYFIFPIALGMRYFKTWSEFAIAALQVHTHLAPIRARRHAPTSGR